MIQSICVSTAIALTQLPLCPLPNDRLELFISPATARALTNQKESYQGTSAAHQLLSAGDAEEDIRPAAAELVRELRKLSGLTWEKISELLSVSPKTVHNWAAGHVIAEKNLARLAELIAVLRFIDRGYGEANRDLLMSSSRDGDSLFSLLAAGEWEIVKSAAGAGNGRPEPTARLGHEELQLTASEHFGDALSLSTEDQNSEILPLSMPGKRAAKARRKRR